MQQLGRMGEDAVHEGYLAWALIGQNKFTVQVCSDWTTEAIISKFDDDEVEHDGC